MTIIKSIPGKEFLENIMERKFDSQAWVGNLPSYISELDKKISALNGFMAYQDNKLQDVMRVISMLIEHLECIENGDTTITEILL